MKRHEDFREREGYEVNTRSFDKTLCNLQKVVVKEQIYPFFSILPCKKKGIYCKKRWDGLDDGHIPIP